jgi:transcriptional regulator with XRE-family HTH domain
VPDDAFCNTVLHFLQKAELLFAIFAKSIFISDENYGKTKYYMIEQQSQLLQVRFLNLIKRKIEPGNSMVYELADLLKISNDSVYRRLRGETNLSFEEILLLSNRYHISMDMLNESEPGLVAFHYSMLDRPEYFRRHWIMMLNDLKAIQAAEKKEILYAAIDIPIFHHFNYPALMAFKMFYWQREVINDPDLKDKQFDIEMIDKAIFDIAADIYRTYAAIPSSEIWTEETINSTIKQIRFYHDSGLFSSNADALKVVDELTAEMINIEKQAEEGRKTDLSGEYPEIKGLFSLYTSDIEIGSNTVLTRRDDTDAIYMGFQTFNTIITTNSRFCADTEVWLRNLIKKSTLISGVSQKQRYQFFQLQRNKINRLREHITKLPTE